jgi:hypothetical protein
MGRPSGPPIDPADLKHTVVVNTVPTVLMGFVDLVARGESFALWAINTGPDAAVVQFQASYDAGATVDADTLTNVSVPAGQSVSLQQVNDQRRYWSIMGNAVSTSTTLKVGVTLTRG